MIALCRSIAVLGKCNNILINISNLISNQIFLKSIYCIKRNSKQKDKKTHIQPPFLSITAMALNFGFFRLIKWKLFRIHLFSTKSNYFFSFFAPNDKIVISIRRIYFQPLMYMELTFFLTRLFHIM